MNDNTIDWVTIDRIAARMGADAGVEYAGLLGRLDAIGVELEVARRHNDPAAVRYYERRLESALEDQRYYLDIVNQRSVVEEGAC